MNHLQDQHDMDARVSEVTCPLCVEFTSRDRDVLSLHVARHMEEIALAILPSGVDSDAESVDGSSQDGSRRSSLNSVSAVHIGGSSDESSSDSSDVVNDDSLPTNLGVSSRPPGKDREALPFKGLEPRLDNSRQDENGVHWFAFEYSRDGVKTEYTIRYDIEKVDIESLPHGFKIDNCIFPRALVPRDQYKGDHQNNEKTWNAIGWALAELNPSLQGRRGVLREAAESAFASSVSSVDNESAISQSPGLSTSASHLSSTVDPSERLAPARKKLNLSDYTNLKANLAQTHATKAGKRDPEASIIAKPVGKSKIYGCPGNAGRCLEHRNRQWRSKIQFWTHFETHLQEYQILEGYQCLECAKRYLHGRELAMHIWNAHMVSSD